MANNDIAIYEGPGGRVEVRVDRETVWLTQRQMAELFDSSTDNISLHLKSIYADQGLEEPATTQEYSVVQSEGARQVRRTVKHYNLVDVIARDTQTFLLLQRYGGLLPEWKGAVGGTS